MQETHLDVNLIIQAFQDKLSQATTDLVIKDATIKQLQLMVQQLQSTSHSHDDFEAPSQTQVQSTKKDK